MIDRIKQNAQLVVSIAEKQLDTKIAYDREGVAWLDGYIQRQHEHGDPKNHEGLINTLGSFFGECIIATYGGEWQQTEYGWSVTFANQNAAFPFAKVSKHLENGSEDSVLSMFDSIPVLFAGL
jgi:hypothetical protein